VLDLSVQERVYLIDYITEKQQATEKAIAEMKQKQEKHNT
jgi:hypothetical protein